MSRQSHIQSLMNLLLILIFVIGSFFIISSEIQGYQNIHESILQQEDLTIPLSYIHTKLKENENQQMIQVKTINQHPCLIIQNQKTITYIYYQDGYLQEIYADSQYTPLFSQGEKLFAIDDFQISYDHQLYTFIVTKHQRSEQLTVYIHR